jgi:hypothetical protein
MYQILTKNHEDYRAEWKKLPLINDSDTEDEPLNIQETDPDPEDSMSSPYSQQDLEIKFYKNDKYIFSVHREFFESDPGINHFLIEWIRFNQTQYLILGHSHGSLKVIDPETGGQIAQSVNNDMFVSDYKFFDDNQYLYLSGWFWSPVPMRTVFHIPSFLQSTDKPYEPISVTCAKSTDKINPGICLYGAKTCKEFLENHQQIVDQINHETQVKKFNLTRCTDTLLRRFYEIPGLVRFEADSKELLGQILSSDRKIFYAQSIGNQSGLELDHGWALTHRLDAKYQSPGWNSNYLISDLLFRTIDMMPLKEIDFRFQVSTDLGNLLINLHHKLIDCDKLSQTYGDQVPGYLKDRTLRIDPETKFDIQCRIIE